VRDAPLGAAWTAIAAAGTLRPHASGRLLEGIDSERGLEWRRADSLSLREFLRLGKRERVPDQSWLSRTRSRLPLELHDAVFTWVPRRLSERGLVKGEHIGVDASTMQANAALRAIVRRGSGEGHREMLTRMARESGIETPTAEYLIRLDRARKGKTLSKAEWESPTDPDARIARRKDSRTRLAQKPSTRSTLTPARWSPPRCTPPIACRARWRAPRGISTQSRPRRTRRRRPNWSPTRATIRARR
jgi:hypothetical protein